MTQFTKIRENENEIEIHVDPKLYDDHDSEIYEITITREPVSGDPEDYYCESCDEPSGIMLSFEMGWESNMSQCLRHQPQAVIDYVNSIL